MDNFIVNIDIDIKDVRIVGDIGLTDRLEWRDDISEEDRTKWGAELVRRLIALVGTPMDEIQEPLERIVNEWSKDAHADIFRRS